MAVPLPPGSSPHRFPYRTDLVAPNVLLLTSRHGQRRNTPFPVVPSLLRVDSLLRERVYWAVAQKLPWYIRPSCGHCISTALHATILSSHLCLALPSGLSPFAFQTKIICAFLFSPRVLPALPISSSLTWSFQLYLAKSTSYEAPHYAVFPNLLSLRPLTARSQNLNAHKLDNMYRG
jgi:hypothetical protein